MDYNERGSTFGVFRITPTVAVSPTFRAFVLDQLGQLVPRVRGRAMFGGLGIYSAELFFALIAYETLFLKVDDETRPYFESIGSQPFRPFEEHGTVMSYYDVPLGMLETVSRLQPLVEMAVAAAERAKKKKTVRKPAEKKSARKQQTKKK